MQTTSSIRKSFIKFFEEKSHKRFNSSSVISKDDPTLMFVNAGMNQFKDIFLGYQESSNKRIVNSQKCLRVSGKHNDLDQVGLDTYHHTFFEMLGNWSFGDYGKDKAIDYAWQFLINVCGLDKSKIYVTVFSGDSKNNITKDKETFDLWKKYLPTSNILYFEKDDNFWEMGDTGPCGPCTEIHYDNRTETEIEKICGSKLVNKNHNDVIEIWNIVFIKYNRSIKGNLTNLSTTYVDTGMGLERLAMIIQNKKSNYDIDIFQCIIKKISKYCKINYGSDEKKDIAFRVIADHARAAVFTIADGLVPSNNKSGYVIRKIIRRASRYAYTELEIKEPVIFKLVEVISEIYSSNFDEVSDNLEIVKNLILDEEKMFLKTLSKGLKRINKYLKDRVNISGDQIFELYDTYGFPYDLTKDILIDKGLVPDEKNFKKALDIQKDRSRSVGKIVYGDWVVILKTQSAGFTGYDKLDQTVKIIRYRKVKKSNKNQYQIVLNKTPFFPESGGQVADSGVLKANKCEIKILNVKRENNTIIHHVDKLPKHLSCELLASVDKEKRHFIAINHTATHILHNVLRKKIGNYVQQKGSFLNENYLRFDFNKNKSISKQELLDIENSVNDIIWKNHLVTIKEMDLIEAKRKDAIMFFEEKYSKKVRVVSFYDSIELCGGTHVKSTSEVGLFKIIKETSVSSGIRRIEALTNKAAFNFLNKIEFSSRKIIDFTNEKDFELAIEKIINGYRSINKERNSLKFNLIQQSFESKINSIKEEEIVVKEVDSLSIKELKQLGPILIKSDLSNKIVSFFVSDKEKYSIIVHVPKRYQNKYQADIIVKKLTRKFGGGGGGNSSVALAGGLTNISEEIITNYLKE